MVNVTKENFIEQSNDLIRHLQTAAFVAIDEEMTGIQVPMSVQDRRALMRKDLPPNITYPELKRAPERYSIIQLGVSLFHANTPGTQPEKGVVKDKEETSDEEGAVAEDSPIGQTTTSTPSASVNATDDSHEPSWTVRSYNFYMFPSPNGPWDDAASGVREIVLNPSSVSFLNEHNMSFDLWTQHGVNYVTGDRAEQIIADYKRKYEEEQHQAKDSHAPPSVNQTLRRNVELTRTEDVRFFASAMASLREWLDNASGTQQSSTTFLLPSCNSFLRRALYENIEKVYPDLILENAGGGQIRVLRLSQQEKTERDYTLKREGWSKMIHKVGMWRVFDALSRACRGVPIRMESPLFAPSYDYVHFEIEETCTQTCRKVPLVVHNGFMDLLFLMTHFDAPQLPDSLSDCLQLVSGYFPVIYDTKVVSTEYTTRWNNEQTNLSSLYSSVVLGDVSLARSIVAINADDQDDAQQEHEAAYDAFVTGSIYIGLCQHVNETLSIGSTATHSDLRALTHLQDEGEGPRLRFGRNKVYTMSMFTLDLENPDIKTLKCGMHTSSSYYVSDIDPSVTTRDIVRCCSDLVDDSGRIVNFNIIWVDNVTFIVAAAIRSAEPLLDASDSKILLQHGEILRNALQGRFSNQEKIVTLDEYLKTQESVSLDGASWFRKAIEKIASFLAYTPKRKSQANGLVGAPPAKRQRFN